LTQNTSETFQDLSPRPPPPATDETRTHSTSTSSSGHPTAGASAAMGRKLALLVGINYPGTKAELNRCLVDRFGFDEDDITVLVDRDSSGPQPTGANIRRALAKLVGDASPGDFLFFHYSGHGTRLPAETGQNDDTGYDECIVPSDMNLITGAIGEN
jgi:hypothetical protein